MSPRREWARKRTEEVRGLRAWPDQKQRAYDRALGALSAHREGCPTCREAMQDRQSRERVLSLCEWGAELWRQHVRSALALASARPLDPACQVSALVRWRAE